LVASVQGQSREAPLRQCAEVAEVVRDLWRRERERGLSAGEKRMLAKARQILVSELALAERVEEDKAEVLLDEVLAS
jgi:CarD family transcriptional regulator